MPDRATSSGRASTALALLIAVRRRLLAALALEATSAGLVLFVAIVVAAWALDVRGAWPWSVGGLAGVALAGAMLIRGRHWLRPSAVAIEVERRHPGLDNLLVTIVELRQQPGAPQRAGALAWERRSVHPIIATELNRQADARANGVSAANVAPLGRAMGLSAVVALGAALAWLGVSKGSIAEVMRPASIDTQAPDRPAQPVVTVTVTPPAYTSLPAATTTIDPDGVLAEAEASALRTTGDRRRPDPPGRRGGSLDPPNRIDVLEGSRVRIDVAPTTADVRLVEMGQPAAAFERSGEARWIERTAERTAFFLLEFGDGVIPNRVLALIVHPDAAPVVRIRQPARDLIFPEPRGRVKVEVEATDDLALSALSLRYTRVFGSGENVTFQEGDLPLRVERVARGQWHASSEISLEDLQLADGDTLVYRAVTRDTRPGRDPSSSEAYLLEIGKLAQATSAGFALPEDKDRHAISQQMVIIKTERLLAERGRLGREEVEERSRLLAVEQRMVRAEFVFMTGGEVEDEVAEAEHSHELAEGRFENEGQVELLTAIREMSRAETRLNEVSIAEALTFERAALEALQRAFDRRRYLLRTMPERARIDQGRRLTGAQTDARSWRRSRATGVDEDAIAPLEALAREVAAARHAATDLGALAARVGSIDPAAPDVQEVALRLAAAGASEAERSAAIAEALQLLAARARKALSPTRAWITHDAAAGRYADALAERGGKR